MQRFAGLAAPMKLAASVAGSARGGSRRHADATRAGTGRPKGESGRRREGRNEDVPRLVERSLAGDMAALGTLFDRFAPPVYSFFRFRVDSAAVAEELMQRVFLRLVEELPSYQPAEAPFGAWLFGVARDVWTDHARAGGTQSAAGRSGGSDGHPAGRAVVALIGQAVWSLPASQREIIACRIFAGLSAPETAALMRWSEGSVRDVQHRALAELSNNLGLAQSVAFAPARLEQL
jgi:RNA polymerase sigma-70 factor (ECF subfamily)